MVYGERKSIRQFVNKWGLRLSYQIILRKIDSLLQNQTTNAYSYYERLGTGKPNFYNIRYES